MGSLALRAGNEIANLWYFKIKHKFTGKEQG